MVVKIYFHAAEFARRAAGYRLLPVDSTGDLLILPVVFQFSEGLLNFCFFLEYLLALVTQESMWLKNRELRTLLTRRDMQVTTVVPFLPEPPAIFMLPSHLLVANELQDGYAWAETRTHRIVVMMCFCLFSCEDFMKILKYNLTNTF